MNWPYPYYRHQQLRSFRELLDFNYRKNPQRPAFIFNEHGTEVQKTYTDFHRDVLRFTKYLKSQYIRRRHIAIIGENSYNYLVAFFGIILSHHVAVPIDKDLDPDQLQTLLQQSDTKTIFYSQTYCDLSALPKKYKRYPLETVTALTSSRRLKSPISRLHRSDPDRPAVIFFTSGTTGASKGVMLSERNILANIYGSCSIFRPHGPAFSCLPFHHAFGLVTAALMPFYYNVPLFLNSSLKRILSDLRQAQPNTMFVVPAFVETIYKQIWKSARKSEHDHRFKRAIHLSDHLLKIKIDLRPWLFREVRNQFGGNLEYIICGGAPLDAKYVKWFRSLGINILNGYGITECSPVVAVNRNHHFRDGSVGLPVRGIDIRVIDHEICVKGNIVMCGYYKDAKATKAVLQDGYLHTGDFGSVDFSGFIHITGRKKNLIVLSNGENVSPEAIEAQLAADPAVSEVVVYAQNKKIIAEIYPNEEYLGNATYFSGVLYRYNQKVPKHHQVSDIILRDHAFPKNHSQKILRHKVMEESQCKTK